MSRHEASENTELPEFTAYEVNELRKRASDGLSESRREYYQKCLNVVDACENGDIKDPSEKVARWLWGIKADLKD